MSEFVDFDKNIKTKEGGRGSICSHLTITLIE